MNGQVVPFRPISVHHVLKGRDFCITEFTQPAGVKVPRHSLHAHERIVISFILEGSGLVNSACHSYECAPGDMMIKPAGMPHGHEYGPFGAHCLGIEIEPTRIEGFASLKTRLSAAERIKRSALFDFAVPMRKEIRATDAAAALAAESLVLSFLSSLIRHSDDRSLSVPESLMKAKEVIRDRFAERLTLAEIASLVNVHPVYLAGKFQQYFRISIGKYIRELRMEYAIRQLRHGDKPIAQVALESGFYDHAHFCRFVKSRTGLTPTKLRKPRRD